MKDIWYLLKCPKGNESDYVRKYQESVSEYGLQEVVHFQYQCLMRYGGQWHLERKELLPGCIFLLETEKTAWEQQKNGREEVSLKPCEISCLKEMCFEGNLIEMSKGIIKNGIPIVTSGPLRGKEQLIKRIDRHKRVAEIVISLEGQEQRITVGLEIYEKQL